jgi:hypothetical protein
MVRGPWFIGQAWAAADLALEADDAPRQRGVLPRQRLAVPHLPLTTL